MLFVIVGRTPQTMRKIYIRLPPEDPRASDPEVVGKLEKAMYGTRDAPMIWQREVAKFFESTLRIFEK